MLDYNWLFSATAQCSATIVAILGGFIVNRLIMINTERRELSIKIDDINDNINRKEKHIMDLKKWFLDEKSTDFILKKLNELVADYPLEGVYTVAESSGYTMAELSPYWENARSVAHAANNYFISNSEAVNLEFDVIARTQLNSMHDLNYYIWEKVHKQEKRCRRQQTSFPTHLMDFGIETISSHVSFSSLAENRDNERELAKESSDVEWLNEQKRTYMLRKLALDNPDSMKNGIFVFILFSILGIIFPMVLMPYSQGQYSYLYKWLVIMSFIIGLGSVIWYLISFLHKNKE